MYKIVNGSMPTNITNIFSYIHYLCGLRKTTLQFDVPKPRKSLAFNVIELAMHAMNNMTFCTYALYSFRTIPILTYPHKTIPTHPIHPSPSPSFHCTHAHARTHTHTHTHTHNKHTHTHTHTQTNTHTNKHSNMLQTIISSNAFVYTVRPRLSGHIGTGAYPDK